MVFFIQIMNKPPLFDYFPYHIENFTPLCLQITKKNNYFASLLI